MNTKKRWLGKYTISFLCTCALVYSLQIFYGKSFVFSAGGGGDGLVQHFNSLAYYGNWLRSIIKNIFVLHSFSIPEYDLSIGLGGDIVTTLNYYVLGDPLNLLAVFVPARFTEFLYTALIILRLYLSGIAFYLYCGYHGYEGDRILPGALIYVFSFYSLVCSVGHLFFINPLIYFPLVLLGADKIMKERKPLLFILMCALSAASNFYFFYMITFLTVIYCVFRYLQYHRKEIRLAPVLKEIGWFALYYFIAILIAAPVFIPTAAVVLGSSRVGTGANVSLLYELIYYIKLPIAFFNASADHYAHLGYGAVAFLAVALLFFKTKWKEKTGYKIALLLGTVFLLFPFWGHVLNGFSYATNRWVWGYCFVVSLIVVEMFPDIIRLSAAGKWAAAGLTVLFAAPTFYFRAGGSKDKLLYAVGILAVFSIVLTLIILAGRYFKDGTTVYLLLIMAGIFLSNFGFYSPLSGDNLQYYGDFASVWQDMCSGPFGVLERMENDELQNVRIDTSNLGFNDVRINSAMLYDVNSTSFYYSVVNENTNTFLHELGIPVPYEHRYVDLDSRAMLSAALGAEYNIMKPGNELYLPYNFDRKVREQNGYALYETDVVLPMAYLYDAVIKEQEYRSLSPLQKQQAILQAGAVSESDLAGAGAELKVSGTDALLFEDRTLAYEVEETSGLSFSDNRIEVTENGAFLTLKTDSAQNAERYFSFANLWYEGKEQAFITITDGTRSKTMEIKSALSPFYANIHNFLCNLGYASDHNGTWKIVFSEPGIYTFDSIEVMDQPLGNMEKWIEERRKTEAAYSFAEDSIQVDIKAEKDGLLYVSVPYSKGWKAYVDGEEETICKVNHFGMGLALEQGGHKIEFVYHTPYLRLGAGLMILGIVCCVILRLFCPLEKGKDLKKTANKAMI